MTAPRLEALLLLAREARRAVTVKEWTRNALMIDKNGEQCTYYNGKIKRGIDEVSCEDVQSCCAVGYISYAQACLLPVTGEVAPGEVAAFELQSALDEVLWLNEEVRREAQAALQDKGIPENDSLVVDEWDGAAASQYIADYINEGEGLVPWWNDHVAESREDIAKLFDDVLATIEGSTP